jgi:glycosyltransferase involved in cell wall biosynthesis
MEIIEPLAQACPWADFQVVGGTERDVQRWRRRLRGVENVTLHGFVPHDRAAQFRHACDVLLAPYQESVSTSGHDDPAEWMSPLKIFEYMAAGKPMLCSRLPVLHEVLTHDENAWLCDPNDPADWAEALTRLRNRPEKRVQLGERARREFERHHTWSSRAQKVLEEVDLS